MLRKNRIKKLEMIGKSKKWIPPKIVHENKDGGWTTPTGVKLIEDGEKRNSFGNEGKIVAKSSLFR